ENCLNKTKEYDGIKELLLKLTEMNIKLAIASNKTDVFSKKIVSHIFGDGIFDIVQGKLDCVPKKPNPEIVLSIMDKLKVSCDETIYVGDSDVDVFTAHNAGIKMCGCAWGFRGKDELIKSGADYILNKPFDLINIINQK
ncbi:MAG: HAD family hydrolase, partial [Clostridiales bacterium]|nr:HAD family hydrolase [Clostridiales bacterium]